ncbi:unnamed protein product [Allacma fusca]|uniref:Uncharacterized protein n=1 Tax=Allacma fusca TaxID=39272 RepID=A0A8J2JXA9_9HEXA|nr:unnamed protein product [Allacma fusca]
MSGTAILFILIVLFLIISALGFWCHFCYGESGGRSLTLMDSGVGPTAPAIHIVKRRKCNCSDKFKGLCGHCEGPDFVGADGGFRELDDFNEFGGDKGMGDSEGDPIRGLLNNSSGTQNSGGQQTTVDLDMDRVVYISNDYY